MELGRSTGDLKAPVLNGSVSFSSDDTVVTRNSLDNANDNVRLSLPNGAADFVPRSILRRRTPSPSRTDSLHDAQTTVTTPHPASDSDSSVCGRMGTIAHYAGVYFAALRPWSLTASMTPVCLGTSLAYKQTGHFDLYVFLATCLSVLAVHAAGNVVNTYYDYMRGVDTMRSDDRLLVDGKLTPSNVASLGSLLYLIGCVGLFLLGLLSPATIEQLALVFFGGLSSSFLYTGGLGLKYVALGDVVVLLTFGPLAVLFAFVSQAAVLSWIPLLYAVPLALNTEAILHSNNTRDIDADGRAGIVTLPILVGRTASQLIFAFLLFAPYVLFAVMTLHVSGWFGLPLSTVVVAFRYQELFRRYSLDQMPQKLARLNLKLGLLYIAACLLTDVSRLPGFT